MAAAILAACFAVPAFAQSTPTYEYSETFSSGQTYLSGSQQYDNWNAFRSSISGTATSITIKGSNDTTGRTCSNATHAGNLASALNSGSYLSIACDGNTWEVRQCSIGGFGISVGPNNGACSCFAGNYVVRPHIENTNWGGVNGAVCGGSTQTLTVSVVAPSAPVPRTYSESFTGGQNYSSGSAQWDNWDTFRASLSASVTSITIKCSNDTIGRTCSTASSAGALANALKNGSTYNAYCNGNYWHVSSFGSGYGISAHPSGPHANTCLSGAYTVRPQQGGTYWGGITGATCGVGSQVLTVEVVHNSDRPIAVISGVPAYTDGSTPFTVTYVFDEFITGFSLSDINPSVINATASAFTETVSGREYTVLITPDGAGDVTVGLAGGVVQDVSSADNVASVDQIAILDTPPSVSILSAPTSHDGTTAFNVTFEFSEDVTGFVISDITLSNASASSFVAVDGNTYTADITPGSSSDITIDVASAVAQDVTFNDNLAATQVTVGSVSATIGMSVDTANVTTVTATLTYTITVANTGTVALASPALNETFQQSATTLDFDSAPSVTSGDTNTNTIFDVGETWVYSAVYTVTQANMDDASDITCSMSFTATDLPAINDGPETTTITANPLITVTKTADKTTDVAAGEDVIYTYVVTNTGNQTLTAIDLSDVHNGSGTLPDPANESLTTDAAPTSDSTDATADNGIWDPLAPGDAVTFTATYQVTQSDVDTLQ